MAICEACGGSGFIFVKPKPLTFCQCPLCGGARSWPAPEFSNPEIKMHEAPKATKTVGQSTEFMLESFSDGALMAHVMKEAGLFNSVSQARKNGWDKPIQKGAFTVGKGKNQKQIIIK